MTGTGSGGSEAEDLETFTLPHAPGTGRRRRLERLKQPEEYFREYLRAAAAARQAIRRKHAALGGAPGASRGVGVEAGGGDDFGFYRIYERGTIYWREDLGACWVQGAVLTKYQQLGAEGGLLGYPRGDESAAPDGTGRFNDFENGAIYWHPDLGAHEVHGAIFERWILLGATAYGYPRTDETAMPDGVGRCSHFRTFLPNGGTADAAIYWTPTAGACELRGTIDGGITTALPAVQALPPAADERPCSTAPDAEAPDLEQRPEAEVEGPRDDGRSSPAPGG